MSLGTCQASYRVRQNFSHSKLEAGRDHCCRRESLKRTDMNSIEESASDRTTSIGLCVDDQHDYSCKSLSIMCTLTLQRCLLIETGWNGLQETRSIFDSLRCKEKRRLQLPLHILYWTLQLPGGPCLELKPTYVGKQRGKIGESQNVSDK